MGSDILKSMQQVYAKLQLDENTSLGTILEGPGDAEIGRITGVNLKYLVKTKQKNVHQFLHNLKKYMQTFPQAVLKTNIHINKKLLKYTLRSH